MGGPPPGSVSNRGHSPASAAPEADAGRDLAKDRLVTLGSLR
jgi:hypothetical protein